MKAEEISLTDAKAVLENDESKKPLFHIHGFNVQTRKFLHRMGKDEVVSSLEEFNIVPVCWPSVSAAWLNPTNDQYSIAQDQSKQAGIAFNELHKALDEFSVKSVMCHSMGNRVLRHAADSKFKFDNIFMVAAVRKRRGEENTLHTHIYFYAAKHNMFVPRNLTYTDIMSLFILFSGCSS